MRLWLLPNSDCVPIWVWRLIAPKNDEEYNDENRSDRIRAFGIEFGQCDG
mgnify:CR=1 FL=1